MKRVSGNMAGTLSAFARSVTARDIVGLRAAGAVLVRTWKETLRTPGAGEVYRRPRLTKTGDFKRSRKTGERLYYTHRASKPGSPPAPDTGALRNSIQLEVIGPTKVRVGTNVEYAGWLEFGTKRIAPRPHARPSAAKARGLMGVRIAGVLRSGARGGGE